jgi:molybdate transport system regulatory protein
LADDMKKTLTQVLKKKGNFRVNGSLWIEGNGKSFLGPGPVELLQYIDETGSINKAAMKMKMSYKKALGLIHALNEQADSPVVLVQSGGDNGGGSVITDAAKEMIKYHIGLRKRFKTFLETETKKLAKLK